MAKILPLNTLSSRHPGLTDAIADAYVEAAAVCLSRHHIAPVELTLQCGDASSNCAVMWQEPDERTKKAWANNTDATEAGAYAVSLAAIEVAHNLVAIGRAQTLTGADYYVAPIGSPHDDLEDCLRLEVSGVDAGNISAIQRRLKEKIAQTVRGKSNLPAISSVVGFNACIVAVSTIDEAP